MRVCVSFSGGKTSAYMARWLQTRRPENEYLYVFANTGEEDEGTLVFVDRCAKEWGMDIHWIEALVRHEERKSSHYREVGFSSASRRGQPFEDVIRKYGIPNQAYPHCTRELKLNPINAFARDRGFDGCAMAVGIRSDEIDRVSIPAMAKGVVYPLVNWHPTTRDDVNIWWDSQPFSLDVPEHRGNCVWCWKKSFRKLATVYRETPEVFEFPARMEQAYGLAGHNVDGARRVFFRKNTSTEELIALAGSFTDFVPTKQAQPDLFWDAAGACSESCDIYAEDYEGAA